MSLFVTLAADALVAILLVASILTSVRLSTRIAKLKADEAAMRQTVGELVSASAAAERAIAGLRAAIGECDRGLSESLDAAERTALHLAAQVEAGDGVIARIAAIVAQAGGRPSGERQAVERPAHDRPAERQADRQAARPPEASAVGREAEPVRPAAAHAAPAPVSNGERLDIARAAAQAMSERAIDRLRARAA